MKRLKALDKKWRRQIRKINKILFTLDKDPNPEIIIDHTNQKLEIHTTRFHKINSTKRRLTLIKIKKKKRALEKLYRRIEKHEKEPLIKNYYLDLIHDLKLNLNLYKVRMSDSYNEAEKTKKLGEIYAELYPVPELTYREIFINEFIDFLEYLREQNLFDISSLDFISELISPEFYLVKRQKTNIDFKHITNQYLNFQKQSSTETQTYNARKIKRIFKSFLQKINISEEIKVKIKNKYLFGVDSERIYIPLKVNHKKSRIIKLIAHEILVHAYRSILGRQNSSKNNKRLFLLESGNSKNTIIEEGLGAYLEQNIFYDSAKYDIYNLFNFYLRTITVHIALHDEPYIVYKKIDKLCQVYEKIFGLTEKERNRARDILILRIYRGLRNPQKGCINGRIGQYLYGNRKIWEFKQKGGNIFNLYAGKIQMDQIPEFERLGFHIPTEFLGHKKFPREYILKLIDECFEEVDLD